MPRLSIITINRNDAQGLERTLRSVWEKQSFKDFEHIIIDGASSDNSISVIEKYESRLTYWISEPDNGVYNAMNKGIVRAQGEYLLFLNSGDWLEDDILLQVFDNSFTEDIVYANLYYAYTENKIVPECYPDKLTVSFLLTRSLGHPSSFIKRKLFAKTLYEEKYRIISDWTFFVRKILLENCTTRHLNLITTYFNAYGMSSDLKNLDLISQERSSFFDHEFPRLISELFHDFKVQEQTLNILSKNKNKQLIDSVWIQKRARQYIKMMFVLKKILRIRM